MFWREVHRVLADDCTDRVFAVLVGLVVRTWDDYLQRNLHFNESGRERIVSAITPCIPHPRLLIAPTCR